MDFSEILDKRYSCRRFSDKKVPAELIDKIIEAGISAPTAVNMQPFKIFRMDSDKAKEAIHKATRFTFGADCFLVIGCKKDDAWTRSFDGKNFAEVDASIAATQMMLEITNLGLSTTWVGHFDVNLLKSLCTEMKDYELIAMFPIGYEADNSVPAAKHFKRKSYDEAVETL